MTFIATVVAQKGAAIIADSLSTLMEEIIELDDLQKYLETKEDGDALEFSEFAKLSKVKPNYTKNYAEKLFQYDKYTAITTAGAGAINGKIIEILIQEHINAPELNITFSDSSFDFDRIVNSFVEFLREQAEQHLNSREYIGKVVFYVTHYNPHQQQNATQVAKIEVGPFSRTDFDKDPSELIKSTLVPDFQTVICDGQNGTADRILYGDLNVIFKVGARIIGYVFEDSQMPMPEDYLENFFNQHSVLEDEDVQEGLKILKMNRLSLQQAVNLAALLMRIERDLQSFTENIPTVGGVIKMAVIGKDGFKMIMGDDIETPNI